MAIPEGYAGFVQPRSGLACATAITLANSPGLIDAGYRDEIAVIVINTDPSVDFEIRRATGSPSWSCNASSGPSFLPVEELPPSDRGLGGFGHTGR